MRDYITKVWSEYDINKNGLLEISEAKNLLNNIVGLVQGKTVLINDAQIIKTFNLYDKDDSTKLTK